MAVEPAAVTGFVQTFPHLCGIVALHPQPEPFVRRELRAAVIHKHLHICLNGVLQTLAVLELDVLHLSPGQLCVENGQNFLPVPDHRDRRRGRRFCGRAGTCGAGGAAIVTGCQRQHHRRCAGELEESPSVISFHGGAPFYKAPDTGGVCPGQTGGSYAGLLCLCGLLLSATTATQ